MVVVVWCSFWGIFNEILRVFFDEFYEIFKVLIKSFYRECFLNDFNFRV